MTKSICYMFLKRTGVPFAVICTLTLHFLSPVIIHRWELNINTTENKTLYLEVKKKKRQEILSFAITWVNLEGSMLSEIS